MGILKDNVDCPMLTRLKDVYNLCIRRAMALDRITTKISNSKNMQDRSNKDEKLRTLWNATKAYFF
jgi:hypothetical protein